MARRPKANPTAYPAIAEKQPSAMSDAPAPTRRGRKPAAASPQSLSPQSLATAENGIAVSDAGAVNAEAVNVPVRGRPGPKPKHSTGAVPASPLQKEAKPANGRRGRKPHQAEPATGPVPVSGHAPTPEFAGQGREAVSNDDAGQDAGPSKPDAGPSKPSGEMALPSPGLGSRVPTTPAAQWDQATDTVRFDWPAIERTASQDGPNQGMAKLLIAARAEGANSRWPL